MLAEKAKQQEELLVEYEESQAQQQELESEAQVLRAQVESMKGELKVRMNPSVVTVGAVTANSCTPKHAPYRHSFGNS